MGLGSDRSWLLLTFCRYLARCGRAGRTFVSRAAHCGDGVEILASGTSGHITKRGREQQFGVQTRPERYILFTTIDVVTRNIGFRIDGPGKLEVRGRVAKLWHEDHDKALGRRRRKDVARRNRGWVRIG